MSMQKAIRLSSPAQRLLLLVPVLLALLAFIFVFRWSIANSAATRTSVKDIAQLTTAWAPDDPQTFYTLALITQPSFLPEDTDTSMQSFERAAALSPFDYRYWLPLAQARERSGDADSAERTLRHALKYAPHYAQVHWALGNILLRQGKTDEAFSEMKMALEANPIFSAPAAATVLQFSDEAPAALLEKLGNSSEAKAAMALTLVRQKRVDEGVAVWNTIPENERGEKFKNRGNDLSNLLLAENRFRYARQINPQSIEHEGGIANAGFESELNLASTSPFDWKIADGAQPRIGFDGQQKHGGNRSLGIVFPKGSGKDFRAISQTVAVDANASYSLGLFYRSEIETTGQIHWDVVDAGTGEIIASSKDLPNKSSEWEKLDISFKTSDKTEGVTIRLVRAGCQNCSIEGKLWFDSFELKKQ